MCCSGVRVPVVRGVQLLPAGSGGTGPRPVRQDALPAAKIDRQLLRIAGGFKSAIIFVTVLELKIRFLIAGKGVFVMQA